MSCHSRSTKYKIKRAIHLSSGQNRTLGSLSMCEIVIIVWLNMLVGSYPICCLISQGSIWTRPILLNNIKFQLQSQFNIWCGKRFTQSFNIAVCSISLLDHLKVWCPNIDDLLELNCYQKWFYHSFMKNTHQERLKSLEFECKNRCSRRPVLCDIQHEYKVKTLCGSRLAIYLYSIM